MVMLAYADSLYELGNDVASLDAYLAFVMKHPKSKADDVALLGAAMALKNLDLQEEAMHFLQLINPEHQGLDQEIEHSHKILSEQAKARAILGRFNPRKQSMEPLQ
jgi:TolA-binding protein